MNLHHIKKHVEMSIRRQIDEEHLEIDVSRIEIGIERAVHEFLDRCPKKHKRRLNARESKKLLREFVDVPIMSASLDENHNLELCIRVRLFGRNNLPDILFHTVPLNKLSKHTLLSEKHDSGLHVHLLDKSDKRYQVLFTAETEEVIEKKVKKNKHSVFWEPHSLGKSTTIPLSKPISDYSKKKRVEIYKGVVSLLCKYEQAKRKIRSSKSALLSTT